MRAANAQDLPLDPESQPAAADIVLPEARITDAQLQAARRILEREVRELHAQMRRDAAASPARGERPSS